MADLILRPSRLYPDRPFALQLRSHNSVGPTEYVHIARVSEDVAREIINAGPAFWLFGDPRERAQEVASQRTENGEVGDVG